MTIIEQLSSRSQGWSAARRKFSHPGSRGKTQALWIIFGFVVLTVLLVLSPAVNSMRLLFPAITMICGVSVFTRSKARYVSFVCWLWFLTPLMRRVLELRAPGDATVVLLTPYLVSVIPAATLAYHWPALLSRRLSPLFCMLAAILYGAVVGATNFGIAAVSEGVVLWLAPLCFAFFVYQNRAQVQDLYKSFERSMIAGTALAGAYGVYQYFVVPPWDALWMRGLGNVTFGIPKPMQVRVFSTMNSPQVLALFLTMGVILALRSRNPLRFLAVPAGLLALTLSMARTAWVGLMVGAAYLFIRMSGRQRVQLVLIAAGSVFVFAMILHEPDVSYVVSKRFSTLSDVGHDDSFATRIEGHVALFKTIGDYPFGLGLGAQQTGTNQGSGDEMLGHGGNFIMQNDSTLAVFLISLGGLGSLLAIASLAIVSIEIAGMKGLRSEVTITLKAMLIVLIAEFMLNNVINGPASFLTWACIGFSLAYSAQSQSARSRPLSVPLQQQTQFAPSAP